MKFLLDTHAFLWWITSDDRLSPKVVELVSDVNNDIYLSVASGWEIAIKASLGKITLGLGSVSRLPTVMAEQVRENKFIVLPILLSHALQVSALPYHHRDLFDRLLVAQSQMEDLPILSADSQLAQYDVEVVW